MSCNKRKMKNGGPVDPPSKTTHTRIIDEINKLSSQGMSYDNIISNIDDLLKLKDIQQETEGAIYGQEKTPLLPPNPQPSSDPDGIRYFELGGQIGSMIGNVASIAGIPGLTPILSQLGSMIDNDRKVTKTLQDHFKSLSSNNNPYGNYEHGGKLTGKEDAMTYEGNSHEQGGIQVNSQGVPSKNAVAEVENDEVVYSVGRDSYIFSSKLKI